VKEFEGELLTEVESDPFTTAAHLMDGKDDPSFDTQTKNDPFVVERNVKRLLNRLSSKNFEEVWPLILSWVNRAEQETNSRTVIQVIRLIFEKATLVPSWTQVGAALCRNIMEGISPKVQDILIWTTWVGPSLVADCFASSCSIAAKKHLSGVGHGTRHSQCSPRNITAL